MTKHITIGYDASSSAIEAARWAAAEAVARSASLRIVSCFEMPVADSSWGYGIAEAMTALRQAATERADEIAATLRTAHPDLEITTEVVPGPVSSALTDHADDELVVVGASGHHGAAAFWLGSTARQVARKASHAAVVVRGAATGEHPARVVVGVDGSVGADDALRWAEDEAALHDTELLIVHGWLYPYLPVETTGMQVRDITQIDAACVLEAAEEHARERLGVPVKTLLVEASPANALLESVNDGDLLVLGSRGRGALASAVFGSTVNAILEHSMVPVVVVHPVTAPA